MLYVICAVKDSAADVFNRPFFVPHRGLAVRDFTDEVRRDDPQNALFKHPYDFDLYFLGQFDDSNGQFAQEEFPVVLLRGKDVSKD